MKTTHRSPLRIMDQMTMIPQTIGKDIPIRKAEELMREFGVRHLPVQSSGRVVGVISDRDIKSASAFRGKGDLLVGEVMSDEPYCVGPEAELSEVTEAMARNKYGSAIVISEQGKALGIFTVNDALELLTELLRGRTVGPSVSFLRKGVGSHGG